MANETPRKKRSQNITGSVATMAMAGASRSVFNFSGNWPPLLLKSTAITMWQKSNGFDREEVAPTPSENEVLKWVAVLNTGVQTTNTTASGGTFSHHSRT